jgi:L-glyceraldehyde 3-phosphate reductase
VDAYGNNYSLLGRNYSHRFDPDTPLEETMGAVDTAVRQGKALYAGISSYSAPKTAEAAALLRELGTPLLIHQPSYSMPNRWIEDELLEPRVTTMRPRFL